MLEFRVAGAGQALVVRPARLIVAGYTGRDHQAVQRHIDELEQAGIAPPESVPMLYSLDTSLLTNASKILVAGEETSGEAEPVYLRSGGDWYLGVGSDHTDRRIEQLDVKNSKGACPKPIGHTVISLPGNPLAGDHDELLDRVALRSKVDGVVYQSGTLDELMLPSHLLALVIESMTAEDQDLDLVIFGGTVPLLNGAFTFGHNWRVELTFGQQVIAHDYSVSSTSTGAGAHLREEKEPR